MRVLTIPYEAAEDWTSFLDIVQLTQRGLNTITFTNTDPITNISAGSLIEVNGEIYHFSVGETIQNSSLLSQGLPVYIRFVVSGSTLTPEYTTEIPVWDSNHFGWYRGDRRYYPGFWSQRPKSNSVTSSFRASSSWDYYEDIATQGNEILVASSSNIKRFNTGGTHLGNIASPSGNIEAIAANDSDMHIITDTGWYKNGSLITTLGYEPDACTLYGDDMLIKEKATTTSTNIYHYSSNGSVKKSYSIYRALALTVIGNDLYVGDHNIGTTVAIMPVGDTEVRSNIVLGNSGKYCFGLDQLPDGTMVSLNGNYNDGFTDVFLHGREQVFSESFIPQILTLET